MSKKKCVGGGGAEGRGGLQCLPGESGGRLERREGGRERGLGEGRRKEERREERGERGEREKGRGERGGVQF